MAGRLVSQRVVMHRASFGMVGAYFVETLDEPGFPRSFDMAIEDYRDFDSPNYITLTIEPGDLLNEVK